MILKPTTCLKLECELGVKLGKPRLGPKPQNNDTEILDCDPESELGYKLQKQGSGLKSQNNHTGMLM